MPRNGSGAYSLPAGNPVVPSTVISSTWANTTLSDLGTAITQSIANDGQTTPVANLPMATFRHTNVGNAVVRTDYAAAGQVQDSSLQWLTSIAGTDTITASITPSPAAYTAGQTFRFVAAATNTGAVTLNVNGLGAKAITKDGTAALTAGELRSGAVMEVVYDGTQFQTAGTSLGRLLNIQTFTANGTYTPTPGMQTCVIYCQGGGGAGGGTTATDATHVSLGAPGNTGSFAAGRFTAATIGASQAVTVGAGGTPVLSGIGGNGGSSSVGAVIIAPGGVGGQTIASTVAPASIGNSTLGAAPTGANLYGYQGAGSGLCLALSLTVCLSANGGATVFGPGGQQLGSGNNGAAGQGYGAGGGGTATVASGGALTGGAGRQGVIFVYEYA